MQSQQGFGFLDTIPKQDLILRDKFIEPPFSVLDTKQESWVSRKQAWLGLGILSEVGRDSKAIHTQEWVQDKIACGEINGGMASNQSGVSIFDPALCELMYKWFCPDGGNILDPFAGGSVRGIVAQHLGFHYDGIELRQEQVDSNREQASNILPLDNQPNWYVGDSEKVLDGQWQHKFDFIFSCPPYVDLEVYSDLPDDLSTMDYKNFMIKYRSIIMKSLALLKNSCFACFVVGEVRDKKGFYYDFVGDTKRAFIEQGARYYNDAVILNQLGSASMRAEKQFIASKKLVKVHQNVLIFKKE
jgi:hypothetical protein